MQCWPIVTRLPHHRQSQDRQDACQDRPAPFCRSHDTVHQAVAPTIWRTCAFQAEQDTVCGPTRSPSWAFGPILKCAPVPTHHVDGSCPHTSNPKLDPAQEQQDPGAPREKPYAIRRHRRHSLPHHHSARRRMVLTPGRRQLGACVGELQGHPLVEKLGLDNHSIPVMIRAVGRSECRSFTRDSPPLRGSCGLFVVVTSFVRNQLPLRSAVL